MSDKSHLRKTPRPDVPVRPSGVYRLGLTLFRVLVGIPLMLVWIPFLGASYFLLPKPYKEYSFLRHAMVRSRWILDRLDDWPAPETPEVAWAIRQLSFADVRVESIDPVPDRLREGIAICPEVQSVTRPGYWLIPKGMSGDVKNGEKIMMQIHGGGFKIGHPVVDRIIPPASYGAENGMRIFSVNYRKCLTADTAFPAPLLDALAGYLHLTEKLGIPAKNILLTGESAGGLIVVMLSQYLHRIGLPQCGRMMMMSPVLDTSFELGALDHHLWGGNDMGDFLSLNSIRDARNAMFRWYTDKTIAGPMCSPAAAPPSHWKYLADANVEVYTIIGTCEVMLPQNEVWFKALREAGIKVTEEILVDGTHVELLTNKKAVKQVLESQRAWVQPWKEAA